ncbi:MAG: hypothetical protein JXA60_08460 [Candidatus Coatesbacteria bacterium]|nr:hypothetical protein [Candidatus Coatesbacteria bacterium]
MKARDIMIVTLLLLSCNRVPGNKKPASEILHPTVSQIMEASGIPRGIYFNMQFKDFSKLIKSVEVKLKLSNQEKYSTLWRYYYTKEDEEGKFKYEFIFFKETLYKIRVKYNWDYSDILASKIFDIWGENTEKGKRELIWYSDLFALSVRKNNPVSDWPAEMEFEWRGMVK